MTFITSDFYYRFLGSSTNSAKFIFLDNTTQAHNHVAPAPGGNGPVVLLLLDVPPAVLIPGMFNGLLGSGTATAEDLTGAAGIVGLDDLRQAITDARTYVNVHSMAFPGGEIRGLIE